MYRKTILRNNIRIVTHPMVRRDSLALGVWIGAGGRYENDRTKGAAHFLEHILFKGTKKYSCDDIKKRIEGVGGSLNAFTAEEYTCYYAKIPAKYVESTFDILADMVTSPLIAKKDIDKERNVILEEIKMYRDLPQHFVLDLLDSLMWPQHPLGKSLVGTFKSIGGMSYTDLRAFHRTQYAPNNIVIAAAGGLNHKRFVHLVEKKFKGIKTHGRPQYIRANNSQLRAQVKFFRKDIEQMHVAFGVYGLPKDHKDRHALNLLNIIMGGNMSSRLFDEVREKRGLAYAISTAVKALQDTGIFLIRAGVDNSKVTEAIKVIIKELNKVKNNNVTKNEFTRAKDYYMGQILLGLEDTLEHMLWLGEPMISLNKTHTLAQILEEVKKVSVSDIRRVARTLFKEHHCNLSIVGPLKERQEKEISRLLNAKIQA